MIDDSEKKPANAPASAMRLVHESNKDLLPEQLEYIVKIQTYLDEPGYAKDSVLTR